MIKHETTFYKLKKSIKIFVYVLLRKTDNKNIFKDTKKYKPSLIEILKINYKII